MQARQAARHRRLAAAGRAEYRRDVGGRRSEAGVQRKVSDPAAEHGLNSARPVGGRIHGFACSHGRTPALRFSISVIVRITAKAKITMPAARMLASRHRDAST